MTSRKLQAEIEKVIKKIAEGVEVFEGIFSKIQTATTLAQKEKYEGDLKKEIKKLQRFRDQIKTWQALNEIKDKKALIENRRLIETQMERFKACEKELKTKAFSKEGLNAATKIDPKEQEKEELCSWVNDTVESLSMQLEKFDAELEMLLVLIKKSKKHDTSKSERLEQVKYQIERHKFHILKLEIILRMLENGNLSFEEVHGIQEDVNFYVESNEDPDFAEDEGIYDDLNLEEAEIFGFSNEDEENQGSISDPVNDVSPASPGKNDSDAISLEKDDDSPKGNLLKEEDATAHSKSKLTSSTSAKSSKKDEIKHKAPPKIAPLPPKPGTAAPVVKSAPEPPAVALPIKYASAAAASLPPMQAETSRANIAAPLPISYEKLTHADSTPNGLQKEETMENANAVLSDSIPNLDDLKHPVFSDLISSFDTVKWKSQSSTDRNYFQLMLDSSLQYRPEASDSERPFSYLPKTPYPTPGYYPQIPYAMFDKNPLLFEKFDIDALFFIFYYQQGSYQQYLAARQLKRNSWRFHKKYLTWFQRHEEPSTITDEYEQGTYIYFDYEAAWCRRKKVDFRFISQVRILSRRFQSAIAQSSNGSANSNPDPKIVTIVDQISKLNLLETAKLVENLKLTLGIQEIAMPVAAAVPPAATAEETPQENAAEKTLFTIKLEKIDTASKAKIIKEIKGLLPGANLIEAKKFVEGAPKVIRENVSKEEAEKIKKTLEAVGATILLE